MADVHDNKEDHDQVRLMTYEDEVNYDDITIEETIDEEPPYGSSKQGGNPGNPQRPKSFDRVYEDNSSRQQGNNRTGYRVYGSGRGPKVFSINLGHNASLVNKWKYRIVGVLVAAAVVAFLLFVALPFLSVVVLAAVIAYLLYSLLG